MLNGLTRKKRKIVMAGMALGAIYSLGLGAYVAMLPQPFTKLPANTQGIAVFTGGAGRIETTLQLVQQGFSGPVLISGLHPDTRLTELLASTESGAQLNTAQQQQIMLDTAASTAENMQSLKLWAATTDLTEIALITSTYHAARVRLLAWWHAPELIIHVLAVQPENPRFGLLLREYHKLLVAPFLR